MTFERTSLTNGVRILTAPMPNVQSTSCFLMFAAGSRYETKESNGIAHFAEHMFFKGTERRPTSKDISGEIDSIAASSTRSPARSTRATTSVARPSMRRSRSTCSST